jgi:hypothetical protein
MKGTEFIQSKQQSWACRQGIKLVGSTIPDNKDKGEKNYVTDLSENLFEPLSEENVASFKAAKGHEIEDSKNQRAKMKALHSSSALAVNVFQYWQTKGDKSPITSACGLPGVNGGISFEGKYKINGYSTPPTIDVVIKGSDAFVYAIESKFSEPYGGGHNKRLKPYISNPAIWSGLSNVLELAESIYLKHSRYRRLDAAQLIKHILGLKHNLGAGFHLLYLWYDVDGKEGVDHRREIELFASIVKEDGINFSHVTYQDVITKLKESFYIGNEEYCDYLTKRYLKPL